LTVVRVFWWSSKFKNNFVCPKIDSIAMGAC
jgi:hypothetical protein